jgi:serine/threonine protein kinase/Tol biopolymer transport system component
LDAQRWARIEELFHRACECNPEQRARFLEEACDGDTELRGTVEVLLASDERAANDLQSAVHSGLDAVAFPLVGETISHYRILEGIDTGGMGSVYRAEDVKLGRQVALKFLAEEFARDAAALSRFEREARSASALEHANICPIYEFGEHAGRPFLAMQLLEGQTLRDVISRSGRARRPFALPELLNLALQITEALEGAHQHGIIHRDIKPANIFVTKEGQVKVLDFGLAKPTSGELADGELQSMGAEFTEEHGEGEGSRLTPTPNALVSRTGAALGTTAYMSPEQARGEKLDARTDIYSLGLVLYEMATGQRAFEGATEPILHDAIFHQSPAPLRRVNPTLPAEFERILGKCLERDRDARYPTAGQVRADLEALRAKATRKPPYRSWIAAAASLALLTALASIWVAWQHAAPVPRPNVKVRQLTTNSWENAVRSGALSPDGRYLAYADTKGLHVKLVGSDSSQLVARPEALRDEKVDWDISPYAWFPDSRQFIATSHPPIEQTNWAPLTSSISTIWVIPVTAGPPRKLRDAAIAWSVSRDGSMIAFGADSGRLGERELWVMGPNGEQARRILQVDEGRGVCCLSFFQDGRRVSYVTSDKSGDAFVMQDLNGGPVATLMDESATMAGYNGVWLPDGHLIYSDCVLAGLCTYWIERFDTRSGRLTEKARRLTDVVGASVDSASATPDGRLVAFIRSTESGTSYVADLEAYATQIGKVAHFTLDESHEAITGWTADSRTAIIVSNHSDYSAVYRQNLGTDVTEPIIARNEKGLTSGAVVSPDAKWLLLFVYPLPFGATPPSPQVWRVPISGGDLKELFSLAPGSGFYCARAPATLCVTAEPTANRKEIVVAAFDPATGVRGRELLRFDRYPSRDEDPAPLAFALSPDGQWVSTSVGPAGPLRILSLRGDPPRVLPVKGLNVQQPAAWTPDGRGLIVTTYRDDAAVLLHVDLQGNAQELFKCDSAQICFGVPSPDGKHLGIYQSRRNANIWMLESF